MNYQCYRIFSSFLSTFPFITNNSIKDQQDFWQGTLQPFIESFNSKPISGSEEREEHVTKRRQVNKRYYRDYCYFIIR